MSSAPPTPTPILLVIDLQQGLVDGEPEAGERSTPQLTSNVAKVLHFWRQRGWPIIHVHHDDPDPDHPLNKIHYPERFKAHACSAPAGDEPLLHKHVGSAFFDPKLELVDRIRRIGGDTAEIVVIGMDGAQCVNDNTRAAVDLGFQVKVVADACATYAIADYRDAKRKLSAEDSHAAAMSLLANGYATVLLTDEFLRM